MKEKEIDCKDCQGKGWYEHCVNPDNGYLDTHINMLRYERFTCTVCKGTGKILQTKEKPNG